MSSSVTYREEQEVAIVSGLSEKEWARLSEEFLGSCMSAPLTNKHVTFSLTAKQSAFFSADDIDRLVSCFTSPALKDPRGWFITDLHGRKTLYLESAEFKKRMESKKRSKTEEAPDEERAHRALIHKFVRDCIDPHSDNTEAINKKVVYMHFFFWMKHEDPENDMPLGTFARLFETLYRQDFITETKRGVSYTGFKVRIKGYPAYPD